MHTIPINKYYGKTLFITIYIKNSTLKVNLRSVMRLELVVLDRKLHLPLGLDALHEVDVACFPVNNA